MADPANKEIINSRQEINIDSLMGVDVYDQNVQIKENKIQFQNM